ncbi:MAG TPA: DUF1501 domain-containing protein [Chloroflexota bacterium]
MQTDSAPEQRCCDEYDEYRRNRWSFQQNRLDFLKTTVGALAAAPLMPHMVLNSALAQHSSATPNTDPILVVVQLAGGNDGLNTIVPYSSGLYYSDRPNIAVPAKSVIPIDATVGFNPNLKGLKSLFDTGKLAVVQGVGYDNPSRSHFQGTSIWETANTTGISTTGWLGRFLDAELAGSKNPLTAIALGPLTPQTLISTRVPVTTIDTVANFRFQVMRQTPNAVLDAFDRMYTATGKPTLDYLGMVRSAGADAQQGVQDLATITTNYKSTVQYPPSVLARELQTVAQMISANLGTRIFHVTVSGFDDHVAEVYTHANLLKALGDSLTAFYADLTAQGKADQVVSMTFSEFGRRVRENAGRGTDHGTAAPMFIVGGKVKGGLYGDDPILSNLDDNGDLKYGVDFRSVYGTVLDGWMGGNSKDILGGSYERLPFL